MILVSLAQIYFKWNILTLMFFTSILLSYIVICQVYIYNQNPGNSTLIITVEALHVSDTPDVNNMCSLLPVNTMKCQDFGI